jgi:glycosyltransferase involved in cell wall biosynthesis
VPNDAPLPILFVNTATSPPLGADTWIHAQIMTGLERSTHELHAACAFGRRANPTPTFLALRNIADLELIDTPLGREIDGTSRRDKVRALATTLVAPLSVIRMFRLIKRHHIAVIHTSDRPRDAAVCVLLARLTGAVCVVHVHVAFAPAWMGRLLKWSMRRADALVAVSEFVADTLVAGGHDAGRVHVVLNAIDLDRWQPRPADPVMRRELGVTTDSTLVLSVCRLFPEKGPAELIRAIAALHDTNHDVFLVLVGAPLDPAYVDELLELAATLGIAERVTFTGRRGDVADLMAAADIFAMPSTGEPFGLVYAEAMAMERPVVGLANGGTPEVVVDGVTGLLAQPGDLDDLVRRLEALIADPDLRRRMGAAGRSHVSTAFTRERMAADVATVYRLVCSANGGGRIVRATRRVKEST